MAKIKQTVLRSLGIDDAHPWLVRYQACKRKVLGIDKRLKRQYFDRFTCTKLHLGSSHHILDGWLNTDLCPAEGVMVLDATLPYPFADGSFDFVFSEHMIEHVPYEAAKRMLKECYRVLKPQGTIRIVTPDLRKILSIYPEPIDANSKEYLQWMSTTFTPYADQNRAAHVVNAFFRLWGHQFIYDESSLAEILQSCGFTNVKKHQLGQSEHSELQGIEHSDRYPAGLLNYESICLEAQKGSAC